MAHIEKEYLIGDVEWGDEEKRAKGGPYWLY